MDTHTTLEIHAIGNEAKSYNDPKFTKTVRRTINMDSKRELLEAIASLSNLNDSIIKSMSETELAKAACILGSSDTQVYLYIAGNTSTYINLNTCQKNSIPIMHMVGGSTDNIKTYAKATIIREGVKILHRLNNRL